MTDTVAINDKFALGMTFGPAFHTTVIPLAGGYEDRNQDWELALWRYECEYKGRSLTEMREFQRHVLGRRGAAYAFPLRDPIDNSLTDENIGTGDGSTTEFQIKKLYSDADRPYYRPISIVSNLVVKVDGVTQDEGVDYNNSGGWIAFAYAPANGLAITVTCDFMIPVRYDDDNNPIRLDVGSWEDAATSARGFTLLEVIVPKPTLVAPDPTLSISGTPVLTGTDAFYAGFTVSAVGGTAPYTFSIASGALPAGVTLNSSTGEVSGTPTETGTFADIVIRVTDDVMDTDDLAAFTLVVTVGDPYFANVKLLVGFNGTDGATSATDESPVGRALTFVGNAQIDTAQSKFGGASLLCDGTGDRVTAADSLDWQLGSTNSAPWTVEAWVRWSTLDANSRGIMGQNASGGWTLTGSSTIGELAFGGSNFTTVTTSGAGLTTGVWYHLAADKDATGKIRLYVDGVMLGSATPANSAIDNVASPLAIGAQGDGAQVDMAGWIDEVRITKGVARYATDSSFTVPSAAYPRS